jgi:hypothetical protein
MNYLQVVQVLVRTPPGQNCTPVYIPERIKQKKAESSSYAILLYKLRNIGIFRNLTENDYGIDFEIEVVLDDSVRGQYFKAQVKSAEEIYIRKDGIPTVGGIKQSTLNYWCQLSSRTHVLAYAVDLKSENVYASRPLFWQASALIDASEKSKTIEFLPSADIETLLAATLFGAISPSVPDIIYAQTTALRRSRDFFNLYADVFHYDLGSELQYPEVFHTFLDVCRILIGHCKDELDLPAEDKKHAFSLSHWAQKLDKSSTEVVRLVARESMKAMMPLLVKELANYRAKILDAAYYWSHKNMPFLELVHKTPIPAGVDHEVMRDRGYEYDRLAKPPAEDIFFIVKHARGKHK